MRFFQRFIPFVAVFLVLFSIQTTAAPKLASSESEGLVVVNINKATIEQLESLKGVGESKAQAIIAYRDDQGLFKSVDDLAKVRGISENTVDTLLEKNPGRLVLK